MSKTHTRLPSLRAMRAFAVAARTGSFTAAASELSITQSAVSRLVHTLEDELNCELFERNGKYLSLTTTGSTLAASLREGFDIIEQAARRARHKPISNVLTVSMLPSFALKWFTPRLGRFMNRFTAIDLRINATRELSDFAIDVDAAIRFGNGKWTDTSCIRLARERFFPVCSPEFLKAEGGLTKVEQLPSAPLLLGDTPIRWEDWLRAVGIEPEETFSNPMFDDGAVMLQAAIDGVGVALGRTTLVSDDISSGRLSVPFGPAIETDFGCFLVRPNWREKHEVFDALGEWLIDEMAELDHCVPDPVLPLVP